MRALERTCLLAIGLYASGCAVVAVDMPLVPMAARHVRLQADVARGYAAYSAALAPYGTWGPDSEYGVRWCPQSETPGSAGAFQPYASRGHWDAAEAPVGGAPAGAPVWVSEDPDTWGGVTTRHGWWVRVEPSYGPRQWCWVPGAEETPGRVVWRTGDGFVGWAPEAPAGVAYDDVDYNNLEWVYSLLGTLLENTLDGNLLSGEARDTARSATAPAHVTDGTPVRRQPVGPSAAKVGDARKALAAYADAHAVTFAQAVARMPESRSSGSGKSSGSSGSSGSSKSSSSDASAKTKSAPKVSAGMYYDAMMGDPMYLPAGYLPRVPRPEGIAQPMGERSAVGSATSAVHGGSSGSTHAHVHAGSASSARAGSASGARPASSSGAHAGGGSTPTYHPSSSSSSKRSSSHSSKRSSSSSRSSGHHR